MCNDEVSPVRLCVATCGRALKVWEDQECGVCRGECCMICWASQGDYTVCGIYQGQDNCDKERLCIVGCGRPLMLDGYQKCDVCRGVCCEAYWLAAFNASCGILY